SLGASSVHGVRAASTSDSRSRPCSDLASPPIFSRAFRLEWSPGLGNAQRAAAVDHATMLFGAGAPSSPQRGSLADRLRGSEVTLPTKVGVRLHPKSNDNRLEEIATGRTP